MVTIKTLYNQKDNIKKLIYFCKLTKSGSFTLNNNIDIQFLKIQSTNILYNYDNDKVIISFKDNPIINILSLKREIFEVVISENEIILKVKYFPDLRLVIA